MCGLAGEAARRPIPPTLFLVGRPVINIAFPQRMVQNLPRLLGGWSLGLIIGDALEHLKGDNRPKILGTWR